MVDYFSDREQGPRARVQEQITYPVWVGLLSAILPRLSDSSFAFRYPEACPDGGKPFRCSIYAFAAAVTAEVPSFRNWPPAADELPPTLAALDLLEFCHRAIAKPILCEDHDFRGHVHLRFEQAAGQTEFRADVNRILARNGLVYELGADGQVIRLAPPMIREALMLAVFSTGDGGLDSLLEDARRMFLDPDLDVRKDGIRKLWDAWERLKTVESGTDKKSRVVALLAQAAGEPSFLATLEAEARALTSIGNDYAIRHSETDKVPLTTSTQVDYFFHRLFAFLHLLLRNTGRTGARIIA